MAPPADASRATPEGTLLLQAMLQKKRIQAEMLNHVPDHLDSKAQALASTSLLQHGFLLARYANSPTFIIAHINRFAPLARVSGPGTLYSVIVAYPTVYSYHAANGSGYLQEYSLEGGAKQAVPLDLGGSSSTPISHQAVTLFDGGDSIHVVHGREVRTLAKGNVAGPARASLLKDPRAERTIFNLDAEQSGMIPESHNQLLLVSSDTLQVWQLDPVAAPVLLLQASASGSDANPASFIVVRGYKDTVVGVTRAGVRLWHLSKSGFTDSKPSVTIEHSEDRLTTCVLLDASFLVTGDNQGRLSLYERKSGAFVYHMNKGAPTGSGVTSSEPSGGGRLLKLDLHSRITTIDRLGRFFFVGFANSQFAIYDMNERDVTQGVRTYAHPHDGAIKSVVLHENIVVLAVARRRSDADAGRSDDRSLLNADQERGKYEMVVWMPKLDGFDFFFWQSASADAKHNATATSLFYSYMRISNMLNDVAVANPKDDIIEFTSTVDAVVLTINEVVFLKQKKDIDVPFNLLTKLQAALDSYDQSLEKLLTSGRLKRFLTSNRLRKEVEKWNTRLARALAGVDKAVAELQTSAGVSFNYGMMTQRFSGQGSGDLAGLRERAVAPRPMGMGVSRAAASGATGGSLGANAARGPASHNGLYESIERVTEATKHKTTGSYEAIPQFDGYGKIDEDLFQDDLPDIDLDSTYVPLAAAGINESGGSASVAGLAGASGAAGLVSGSSDTIEHLGYIEDAEGRELWKKACGLRTTLLEFDRFVEALREHGVHIANPDMLRRILDSARTGYVSQFKFSEFLKGFGPLRDIARNVEGLMSQPWFHGFISARESELLLHGSPDSTFLVRFSKSTTGSFALAFKSKGSVSHIMVQSALPAGFKIREGSSTYKTFASLDAIIKHYNFVLKVPFKSTLTGEPWFQGDLTATETEDLLSAEPVGTFLVRFSSFKPGALALSFVVAQGSGSAVRHGRVVSMGPEGPFYVDGEADAPRFPTVAALIHHYQKTRVLREPYC